VAMAGYSLVVLNTVKCQSTKLYIRGMCVLHVRLYRPGDLVAQKHIKGAWSHPTVATSVFCPVQQWITACLWSL